MRTGKVDTGNKVSSAIGSRATSPPLCLGRSDAAAAAHASSMEGLSCNLIKTENPRIIVSGKKRREICDEGHLNADKVPFIHTTPLGLYAINGRRGKKSCLLTSFLAASSSPSFFVKKGLFFAPQPPPPPPPPAYEPHPDLCRRGRSGVVTLQTLLQQFPLCRRVVKTRHATSYSVQHPTSLFLLFIGVGKLFCTDNSRCTLLLQSEAALRDHYLGRNNKD